MLRFVETFYRHRPLLLIPAGLALLLSLVYVLIQPPVYDSTVRIWVEKPVLVPDTSVNPFITPAQEQSGVLTELLATRYFCIKVGRRSPLVDELRSQTGSGGGRLQRLMAAVHLAQPPPAGPMTDAQIDDALVTAINQHTLVVPTGSEVVSITYRGSSPEVAAATAQAVADEFMDESQSGQRVQANAAVDFYTTQVKQAQANLATADAAVYQYLTLHPELRAESAVPDVKLIQLRRDDDGARQRYQDQLQKLDEAQSNVAALSHPGANGLRVLDRADVPGRAASITRTAIATLSVGLVVGLVIVVTGVLLLTLADRTVRRPEEVESVLELRLVATIPKLVA